MPFMRNAESKRIQYLRRQLRRGHSEKGREFTEEDKQQMQAALNSAIAKRKEGGAVKRLENKMETEQDRGMAHTTSECAILNEKLDRVLASRSCENRDPELVQRLLGEPGSSQEILADINVRNRTSSASARRSALRCARPKSAARPLSPSRSRSRRAT